MIAEKKWPFQRDITHRADVILDPLTKVINPTSEGIIERRNKLFR